MGAHQTDTVHQFIGAWSLVSWTAKTPDGTIRHPYGEHPVGQILYQPQGRMAACLMRRERTPFASNNRHKATPAEHEAAYREYVSYFGAFTVQESSGTVTHHVEGATFPNWIGTDLVRNYRFSDGTLTLSLTGPDGSVHELTWRRHSE